MKTEMSKVEELSVGIMMLVAGVLLGVLPVVTWGNSVIFGVLYSPGLLIAPLLIWHGFGSIRDRVRSRS